MTKKSDWRETGKKKCTICKQTKSVASFTLDKKRKVLSSRCKPCSVSLFRKTRYGVDQGTYDLLLASQGGGCAICGSLSPARSRTKNFCVDHCHKTGKVRGLLCYPCNTGIGHLKDDEDVLLKAVMYLRRHTLFSKS